MVAGWYDDGSGTTRWWDGAQWTEHTMDAAATAAATTYAPAQPYDLRQAQVFDPAQFAQYESAYSAAPAGFGGNVLGQASDFGQGFAAPAPSHQPSVAYRQPALPPPPRNPLAIASFVLGAVGLGVIGFWLARRSLRQIEETGERGKGWAYAGLAVSGLTFGGLLLVLAVGVPSWLSTAQRSQDIAANAAITDATIAINTFWVDQKAYPASLAAVGFAPADGVAVAYGVNADGSDYCVQASAGLTTLHATGSVASASGDCGATGIAVTPFQAGAASAPGPSEAPTDAATDAAADPGATP